MIAAIISDIHDHLDNLSAALAQVSKIGAQTLLCCGDLCSPFVIDLIARFEGEIHVVFGNNDADLFRITSKAANYKHLHLHGELWEGELGGLRVAMNHYDKIARPLAASERYDVVCFGHNHRFEVGQEDRCLLLNPGPIMGAAFGSAGWERVPATFLTFDTESRAVTQHTIPDPLPSS